MKKVLKFICVISFCASLGFAAEAEYQRVVCPLEVEGIPFSTLSLFDSDPALNYDLIPDNWNKPMPLFWTQLEATDLWVRCNYGQWTHETQLWEKTYAVPIGLGFARCETEKSGRTSAIETEEDFSMYDQMFCEKAQ